MRSRSIAVSAAMLVLAAQAPASAAYWKLAGPPEFAAEVNGQPSLQAGQAKSYDDGEGGVTTTLAARTPTHAEFVTSQPRYGTQRIRFDWDAAPQTLSPGQVPALELRWEILQRWNRFCPQMLAFSHLDWSEDWYTNLGYGYGRPSDFKDGENSGAVRNTTIKVTTNDSGALTLYRHVACGGAWVRVLWKYQRVEGEAPAAKAEESSSPSAPVSGPYWKLAGPPEFAAEVNGQPAAQAGQTKSYDDGEGGVTTTLAARTPTHAEFVTSQPRYGTQRIRFDWDAAPQILRPGEVPALGLRWEIQQRWNRFCPQMLAFSHLDWSEDWYTNLGYGYDRPGDFKSGENTGAVRNSTIKVTTNDSGELTLYRHVACGGAWVRVLWKYKRVSGEAPAVKEEASPEPPAEFSIPKPDPEEL